MKGEELGELPEELKSAGWWLEQVRWQKLRSSVQEETGAKAEGQPWRPWPAPAVGHFQGQRGSSFRPSALQPLSPTAPGPLPAARLALSAPADRVLWYKERWPECRGRANAVLSAFEDPPPRVTHYCQSTFHPLPHLTPASPPALSARSPGLRLLPSAPATSPCPGPPCAPPPFLVPCVPSCFSPFAFCHPKACGPTVGQRNITKWLGRCGGRCLQNPS